MSQLFLSETADNIVHRIICYVLLSFSVLVAASVVNSCEDSCDVQAADGGTNNYYSYKLRCWSNEG